MMKKIFIIGCMLMGAWGTGNSENAIKMVTYFPVPYVAYSNINTSKQLDIGLVSSSVMSLGGEESAEAGLISLNVTDAYLRTGKLDLDMTAVLGNRILAGNRNASGTAELDFEQDLRINKLNDGYSIEADQMTTDVLNLFPERISNAFPSCAATAAEGAPQVSWQQLSIAGEPETFLVCGTVFEEEITKDCSDTSYRNAHKEECCPCFDEWDPICYSTGDKSYTVTTFTKEDSKTDWDKGQNDECSEIDSKERWSVLIGADAYEDYSNYSACKNLTNLEAECQEKHAFETNEGLKSECYSLGSINCDKSYSGSRVTFTYTGSYATYTCTPGIASAVPNGWSGTGTCTQ